MESPASNEHGPFAGTGIDAQRAECERWLANNNRPEAHYAVRPHSVSPPQHGNFEILSRVWVNRNWTDTSKIHCNLCNSRRKFVSGGYLAAYDDGWWYVVGPDCGGEEFFGRFNTAKHRYERDQAEAVAEGGLKGLLEHLGAWQLLYNQLHVATSCAERLTQWLETHEADLFRRLQDVRRSDGRLTIIREVNGEDHNGRPFRRYEEDLFATLRGTQSISRPCVPAAYFKRITGDTRGFFNGNASLLEAILAHQERGELAALRARVESALDDLRRAHEGVLQARDFWSPSNIDWLSAWIAQAGSRFEQKVVIKISNDVVCIESDQRERPITKNLTDLTSYLGKVP